MSTRISGAAAWVRRQDWVLGAQLGCALVVTFHAEYTLALAAGVNEYVAYFVPGALDLYVIRALQKHRDVLLAVLVMVAANVASHLVSAGLVPVGWAVYSAVGGTVPLLLWRGHALRYTRTRKELLWGFPKWRPGTDVPVPGEYTGTGADAVKAPVPDVPEDVPEQVRDSLWAWDRPCDHPAPNGARYTDPCTECGYTYAAHSHLSTFVPAPAAAPEDLARRSTDVPDHVPEWVQAGEAYPPLTVVPDPPDELAEYVQSVVNSPVLVESDWAYLDRAEEYVKSCQELKRKPTVRGMRAACKNPSGKGIGQDRAERLLEHLGVES